MEDRINGKQRLCYRSIIEQLLKYDCVCVIIDISTNSNAIIAISSANSGSNGKV